jgi:hypothetical protein
MLNDTILELIQTDDSFNEGQQDRIINYYESSPEDQKEAIDAIFIALTGYSLGTLIAEL